MVNFKGCILVAGIDFLVHPIYCKFNYTTVIITNTLYYRNKNYHT